jgi:uncharacterized protein YjbI with pentapeptide repeats
VNPREVWTEPEKWAWTQICEGRIADFNNRSGTTLDPKKPDGWSEDRALGSAFLETALLYQPDCVALTHTGVRIVGGWFREPINLEGARIVAELWLHESRFERPVSLRSMRTEGLLSLYGSKFTGYLNINGIEVGAPLVMGGGAEFDEVDLRSAKIGSQMSMTGSKFSGYLNMNGIEVGRALFMDGGAEFGEVDLRSAKIGGQISMTGSKFAGRIAMDSAEVGGSLFMDGGAEFGVVDLRSAKIGGQISLVSSKFTGNLHLDSAAVDGSLLMYGGAEFNEMDLRGAKIGGEITMIGSKFRGRVGMDSAEVGGSLFMADGAEFDEVDLSSAKIDGQIFLAGSKFTGMLDMDSADVGGSVVAWVSAFERGAGWSLVFAKIGSNLDLSGATMTNLDLTGTRIGGELRLGNAIGQDAPEWREGSRMTLRNTEAGAVQDREDSWPEMLDLAGFMYRRLGGFGAEGTADIAKRSSAWFIEWLARGPTYSSQPYEHLAEVLRKGGQAEKADEILYAGRERQRLELQERLVAGEGSPEAWLDFFWKSALHAVIGYGYKVHRTFYWIAFFVVFGAVVIWWSRQFSRHRNGTGAAGTTALEYSIDMLLPIVELRKQHYDIDLAGFVRYYFYVHKLMGFVLVSFLIAGLSGLTR